MTKFALQARWVLPVESSPIAGGVVTIEGERITAVGTRPASDATVQDLGEVILLPGLVNSHTHLEFSNLDTPLGDQGISLPEWIRLVIANRKQQTSATAGVLLGLRESLRAGVTSLGEISTAKTIPAEVALPELIAFQEVIGFSAGRVESVLAELEQRLQPQQENYRSGISPHAPYTVHPVLLERMVELSQSQHLPMAMHLAESQEELQLIGENRGPFRDLLEERSMWDSQVFASGRQPMNFLELLAQSERSLVIHGNYLTQAEIDYVAEHRHRMSVVYCPRTHAYFGHETYPLTAMLGAGVRVAVGTDSRASNPDLHLLDELRFVAIEFESIPPEQILALGTINGAEALGLAREVGSISPGKLANLTAVPCNANEPEPTAALLRGAAQPQQIWLRGQSLAFTGD
ncbi:MAG: amidohydrolase family protein [Bythopirellula sp.]